VQLKGVIHQIPQDRPIIAQKSRSVPVLRQALEGSSGIGSKQSDRMASDANPSVSPWFEQFLF
jgi:hypothetical protein